MCVQYFLLFFRLTEDDHWSTSPTSVAQTFDFIYYIDDVENARQISLSTCFFFFEFLKNVFFSGSFVVVSNKWWIYLEARMYRLVYQSTLSLSFFSFFSPDKTLLSRTFRARCSVFDLEWFTTHENSILNWQSKRENWKIFAQYFRSTWQKRN